MKTIKKLSAIILAVVLLFGSVPMTELEISGFFTAKAYEVTDEDTIYNDFLYYEWRYQPDANSNTAVPCIHICKYLGKDEHVTVPSEIEGVPVVFIDEYAFSPEAEGEDDSYVLNHDCINIKSITIPDTVIQIERGAFKGCKNLEQINLPDTLERINSNAFEDCISLKSIKLPNSLINITREVFKNCSSLTEVDFGDEMLQFRGIYGDAFFGTAIKELTVPRIVSDSFLNYIVFNEDALNGSIIEELNVKTYGVNFSKNSLRNSALRNLTIDSSDISIDENVFGDVETAALPETIKIFFNFPGHVYDVLEKNYGYCGEISQENYSWMIFKKVTETREILTDGAFEYYLNQKGEAVISGFIGYEAENDASSKNFDVVIPERLGGATVTTIGHEAFKGKRIRSVEFPDSVEVIQSGAFKYSSSLAEIKFGSGLKSIGYEAFLRCTSNFLKSITIPEGVKIICGHAFRECRYLEKISAKGVTAVLDYAFYLNDSLTEVDFSENFNYIGAYAFADCFELTSFKHDKSTTFIGEWAFIDSAIETFDFNDKLTEISDSAFEKTGLKSIVLPLNLEKIGDSAFSECENLTEVIIPQTVTTIEEHAFSFCLALSGTLIIPENVVNLGGAAFRNTGYTKLIYNTSANNAQYAFSETKITTIEFGDNVKSISPWMFSNCDDLKSVVCSNSITHIGEYAFSYCDNLESITMSENISYIGEDVFYKCPKLTELTIPTSVTKLNPNVFSENIKTVYYNAENCVFEGLTKYPTDVGTYYSPFYNTSIENVVLGDTVKRIPDYFFREINFIGDIVLPDSVTEIGKMAFAESSVQSIDFSSNLIVIEDCAFKSTKVNLVENVFPDELRMIGKEAFAYCRELEEIYIPDSVVDIAESAFEGSMNLKKVRMSSNVRLISSEAFRECRSLYEFKWDSDIKLISENAFFNCKVLADFDFTGVELLYPNSFSYTGVTVVALGENKKEEATNLVSVETQSFKDCENLETVSIGGNVTTIKSEAFASCANLETAVISDSVVNIATDAFYGCDALTIYCMEDSYAHTYAVNNDIPVSTFVVAPIPNQTYTGSKIEPDVDVSVSGKELVEKTDFAVKYSDNINVGTAKVIVNGKGIYKVLSSIANFTIITKSIAPVTFSEISEQNYTGEAVTPSLTVTDGSNILKEGKDYTVEYKNNVNAGTATATIRGIGNYHGTASVNFEITELSVSQKIINAITDFFSSFFAKILAFFNSIFE